MLSASSLGPTDCNVQPWRTHQEYLAPRSRRPTRRYQPAATLRPLHRQADRLHHPTNVKSVKQGQVQKEMTYLASIFAFLSACTNETRMQNKVKAEPCVLQLPFTIEVTQNRNINFLENILILALASKGIFTPPADKATFSSKILGNNKSINTLLNYEKLPGMHLASTQEIYVGFAGSPQNHPI